VFTLLLVPLLLSLVFDVQMLLSGRVVAETADDFVPAPAGGATIASTTARR
jgi:hypothetical protein